MVSKINDKWNKYEEDLISARELIAEAKKSVGDKFIELLELSPKKMKKLGFPIGAAAVPAHARELIDEDDITLAMEKHFCVVHKGPIEGYSWICPECGAYYCAKCVEVIKDTENICWSCQKPIDPSKPTKAYDDIKKGKKKKEHIVEFIEEPEQIGKLPKEKKIKPKKAIKAYKPLKIAAPIKEIPEKSPIQFEDEKPAPAPEPAIEKAAPGPPKLDLFKLEQIAKFEEYIEKLNVMVQKFDIKFSAGTISQEEYIEKKTMLAEKLGEAMAKRDQLKE